jgi:outer membrane biosynthesis protein TonB
MHERWQKWDPCHKDNKLWGAVITNMITLVMKVIAAGQKAREKETEKTVKTDSGGLAALQHVDTTQEGGPESCQQLQQQPKPKPKLQLKLQPKPQHKPKPKSTPTPG